MHIERLNDWSLTTLPRLNRSILTEQERPARLAEEFTDDAAADLPAPEAFSPHEAQQLVVLLGLSGASIARHYQEPDPARKAFPQEAFRSLPVGVERVPFLSYFARLADATRTGHAVRDSYASVVRWNAPFTWVQLNGRVIATLPGVFDDQHIRTYTGDPGEVAFFELLKKSEALELAANDLLQPISDDIFDAQSVEALERVHDATVLLSALQRLNLDFAARPPGAGGLSAEFFMDVFRQFAVHWECGDIPPSGAQDPEFLRRDLLLGIDLPDYARHVERVFPALLSDERGRLREAIARPPLPLTLLAALGLPATRTVLPTNEVYGLLRRHPALSAWYLLLTANARIASTHLMLSEKYLFKPQRERDRTGVGDRELVSNRRGTTGMDEPLLTRFARARRAHALCFLGHRSAGELAALSDLPPPPAVTSRDVAAMVRFPGDP